MFGVVSPTAPPLQTNVSTPTSFPANLTGASADALAAFNSSVVNQDLLRLELNRRFLATHDVGSVLPNKPADTHSQLPGVSAINPFGAKTPMMLPIPPLPALGPFGPQIPFVNLPSNTEPSKRPPPVKWSFMHVWIAWRIYHNQQKQKELEKVMGKDAADKLIAAKKVHDEEGQSSTISKDTNAETLGKAESSAKQTEITQERTKEDQDGNNKRRKHPSSSSSGGDDSKDEGKDVDSEKCGESSTKRGRSQSPQVSSRIESRERSAFNSVGKSLSASLPMVQQHKTPSSSGFFSGAGSQPSNITATNSWPPGLSRAMNLFENNINSSTSASNTMFELQRRLFADKILLERLEIEKRLLAEHGKFINAAALAAAANPMMMFSASAVPSTVPASQLDLHSHLMSAATGSITKQEQPQHNFMTSAR